MTIANIDIDFEIIKTGNPKKLIICDTSVWSHIVDKPAIIEICLPTGQTVTLNHKKEGNTIYNSSNLYLSSWNSQTDLPDGIYTITLKASPDTYRKKRLHIRTEKLRLKLDTMYMSYGSDVNDIPDDVKELVRKADFMISAAEAAVRRNEKSKAISFYKEVESLIDNQENCKDC